MNHIKSIKIHKPDGSTEELYIISKNKLDEELKEIIAYGDTLILVLVVEED